MSASPAKRHGQQGGLSLFGAAHTFKRGIGSARLAVEFVPAFAVRGCDGARRRDG
jgi:hypothetical protein